MKLVLPAVLVAALLVPPAGAADPRRARVVLVPVASGLAEPLVITHAPDRSGRLFVAERPGRIRIVRNKALLAKPFLDITGKVDTAGEGGILGLAFPPNFTATGNFYVSYADSGGTFRLSRFRAAPGSDVASPTEYPVLSIPHPTYRNHYGGALAFGPYSLLHVSTGDGGGGGDPSGNAQNLGSLLGKVLRIDINRACGSLNYCIPAANPFASSATARREIWLYGLRNPWRMSFDRANRDLWIGDVGQDSVEEIDRLPGTTGGRNMGWDCREGTLNTATRYGGSYCSGKYFTLPLWQYGHTAGCAVIGGHVYRGSLYRSLLDGVYVHGDFCSGRIWGLGRDASGRWVGSTLYPDAGPILTFGDDQAGELYVGTADGKVHRLAAARR